MEELPDDLGPVPCEDFYETLRFAGETVKRFLRERHPEHEWLLIGLEITYSDRDQKGEGQTFGGGYGYLEALHKLEESEAEQDEDEQEDDDQDVKPFEPLPVAPEPTAIVVGEDEDELDNPLPLEFVEVLYEAVDRQLNAAAGSTPLAVWVGGVVTGSKKWPFGCGCKWCNEDGQWRKTKVSNNKKKVCQALC